MSWTEFLMYLQGPGILAVVGVLSALAIEYWPVFQNLESKWKQLSFAGGSLFVPLVGAALSILPPVSAAPSWADLWWPALVAGWSAFGAGTLAHQAHNAIREFSRR